MTLDKSGVIQFTTAAVPDLTKLSIQEVMNDLQTESVLKDLPTEILEQVITPGELSLLYVMSTYTTPFMEDKTCRTDMEAHLR